MDRVTKSQREAAARLAMNQIDDLVKEREAKASKALQERRQAVKAAWLLTEQGQAYLKYESLNTRAQELAHESNLLYNEAAEIARRFVGRNYNISMTAYVSDIIDKKAALETVNSPEEEKLNQLKLIQRDAYNRVIVGNETDLLALVTQIVSEARAAVE